MGVPKRKHINPPRTALEVYELLPLGTPAEVLHNTIFISPAPSFEHQRLITYLSRLIDNYAAETNLGITVVAPVDVYLDENNIVQPDILFLFNSSLKLVKGGKVMGAPDLIIEVLSPGNEKHDLEKKKVLYEKSGVKEYFIIAPKTKTVISYYLGKSRYSKGTPVKGKIRSRLLDTTISF
ncbi:MAG: Uma2 family endonuclease [Bacteroidetes bacterium]|nr:Uma2 family endonuclease [Bacteroidota bacterium]